MIIFNVTFYGNDHECFTPDDGDYQDNGWRNNVLVHNFPKLNTSMYICVCVCVVVSVKPSSMVKLSFCPNEGKLLSFVTYP